MVAVLLAGFLLRLAPMGQNRTLEDEALYSYWGLQIATGSDPMLDREPVDKPPLFPYLIALSFRLLGGIRPQAADDVVAPGPDTPLVGGPLTCRPEPCQVEIRTLEAAARLPGLLASVASIALVYALGARLFRSTIVGLLAALLYTFSPFAALFASTAFVDPWLTAWVLGALLAASDGRIALAGVLAGLAAATKQQGLLFLPLVITFGLLSGRRLGSPDPKPRRIWLRWLLFALGFAVVLGGVIAWDQAREQRPGFFDQSVASYGGLGFASVPDLGHRALEWLRLMGYFWVSPWLSGLLLVLLGAWAITSAVRMKRHRSSRTGQPSALASSSLLIFVVAFLLVHWLLDFETWDRYLLALLPLVALLVARAGVAVGKTLQASRWRAAYAACLTVAVLAALAAPVSSAARSGIPVGGDHGAYDGIDTMASYIRESLPPGSVLYDHWLGHHYRFYLYGAPLHIHWYPDLEDLALDAALYVREPRYIALPSWHDSSDTVAALAAAGVALRPAYQALRRDGTVSFRLFQLVGP
jgi:hypothetical protein